MTIAELFVKLGFKGGDKAKKDIGGIDKAMEGVKGTTLATKAAIVGVVYGMQRLMSGSARSGTEILNLAAATGVSTKALQEWRYAGQQFGATAGEVDGAIVGVQGALTGMMKGEGVPKWLNMLSGKVNFDWFKGQKDPIYAMKKIQEMAQELHKSGNAGMTADFAKAFGLSNNVLAAMLENGFNDKVFSRAPKFGGGELKRLRQVDAQWKNFFQKFDIAIGKLNAVFGPDMMRILNHLANAMLGLTKAYLGTVGNTADWLDAANMSPEERKKKGITLPFVDQSWSEIFGLDEGSKLQGEMERKAREKKIQEWNRSDRSIMDLFRSKPSGTNDKSAAIFNMEFKIGNGAEPSEISSTVKQAVNTAWVELEGKGLTV